MPPLMTATIVLWVVGIVLIVISVIIRPRSAADAAAQPTLPEILAQILSEMLKAFDKIVNGPTWSDRFQGAGSLCILLGIVTAGILFVAEVLLRSNQTSTVTPTPSPSVSSSPASS